MFVSTAISASMTFVASQRPPRPASTTATSTPASASRAYAAAVSASNCVTRVAGLERAIDELGGRPRAGGRRREPLRRDVGAVDADALGEGDEVRREVRAGAHAVVREERRDHPRRRGLAVRADDVDRAERLVRRPERRHELAHPVQAEAHAEELERQQPALGVRGVQPVAGVLAAARATAPLDERRQLRAQPLELVALGRRRPLGGAFATKPSLASLPVGARDLARRASRAAAASLRSAAPRSTASDGQDADRAAGDRDRRDRARAPLASAAGRSARGRRRARPCLS